jgi:hypothetical protein
LGGLVALPVGSNPTPSSEIQGKNMKYNERDAPKRKSRSFDWAAVVEFFVDIISFIFCIIVVGLFVWGCIGTYHWIETETRKEEAREQKMEAEQKAESKKEKALPAESVAAGKKYSLEYKTTSKECTEIASDPENQLVVDYYPKEWLQGCLTHATNRVGS